MRTGRALLAALCLALPSRSDADPALDGAVQQMQAANAQVQQAGNPDDAAAAKQNLERAIQTFYQVYTRKSAIGPSGAPPPGPKPVPAPAGSPAAAVGTADAGPSSPVGSAAYGQKGNPGGGAKPGSSAVGRGHLSLPAPGYSSDPPAGAPGNVRYEAPPGDAPALKDGALPYIPFFSPPRQGAGGAGLDGMPAPAKLEPRPAKTLARRRARNKFPLSSIHELEGGETLLERIDRKMQQGDFEGALLDANRAIAEDPADPVAHLLRAEVLCRLERFAEAETSALEAARLDPELSVAFEVLAWAQLNLGRYGEAVASASQAILLDPKDAFAYAIRAYANEQLGAEDSRLQDMLAAAGLNPAAYGPQLKAARAGGKLWSPGRGLAGAKKKRWAPRPVRILVWILLFGVLLPILAGSAWISLLRRSASGSVMKT